MRKRVISNIQRTTIIKINGIENSKAMKTKAKKTTTMEEDGRVMILRKRGN
jgi:hypothetical protein